MEKMSWILLYASVYSSGLQYSGVLVGSRVFVGVIVGSGVLVGSGVRFDEQEISNKLIRMIRAFVDFMFLLLVDLLKVFNIGQGNQSPVNSHVPHSASS